MNLKPIWFIQVKIKPWGIWGDSSGICPPRSLSSKYPLGKALGLFCWNTSGDSRYFRQISLSLRPQIPSCDFIHNTPLFPNILILWMVVKSSMFLMMIILIIELVWIKMKLIWIKFAWMNVLSTISMLNLYIISKASFLFIHEELNLGKGLLYFSMNYFENMIN